jgi:hypothetical protein
MEYFNEASVLYMFLKLYVRGMKDMRLISRPICAPSFELENTNTNTPLTEVVSERILFELLGVREERVYVLLM